MASELGSVLLVGLVYDFRQPGLEHLVETGGFGLLFTSFPGNDPSIYLVDKFLSQVSVHKVGRVDTTTHHEIFRVPPNSTLLQVVLLRVVEAEVEIILDVFESMILTRFDLAFDVLKGDGLLDELVVVWIDAFWWLLQKDGGKKSSTTQMTIQSSSGGG